jgi:hypothetical protein
MNLKELGRKRSRLNKVTMWHTPGGAEEIIKTSTQGTRCSDRDLNLAPHENESKALPLWKTVQQKRSFKYLLNFVIIIFF